MGFYTESHQNGQEGSMPPPNRDVFCIIQGISKVPKKMQKIKVPRPNRDVFCIIQGISKSHQKCRK